MTAYATPDFWSKYREYVDECFPRHLKMFMQLMNDVQEPGGILDLGCGQVQEGRQLTACTNRTYIGIDKDKIGTLWTHDPRILRYTIQADYRTELPKIRELLARVNFEPGIVLSMFSIEPTGDRDDNHVLYEQIFDLFPSIHTVISTGFYYEGKESYRSVKEFSDSITSYQTVDRLYRSNRIKETRILERGPSQLFGPDVIEVWRLLRRTT